jgi:4-alpha-glucanotransferase
MTNAALTRLAEAVGISIEWVDAFGKPQSIAEDALRAVLEQLGYPAADQSSLEQSLQRVEAEQESLFDMPLLVHEQHLPLALPGLTEGAAFELTLEDGSRRSGQLDDQGRLPGIAEIGYHRVRIGEHQLDLAIAPGACPAVDDLTGAPEARIWGITAQLYSLRRPGDGGLGDTGALETLIREVAAQGADAVAISPVHAMFAADPGNYSPYSPSSRMFFNVLHSAPDLILGQAAVDRALEACGQEEERKRLEALDLIDWAGVSAYRLCLLRQLHQQFSQTDAELQADYRSFCQASGEALEQHARFEALHASMLEKGLPGDWRYWPQAFHDPHGPAAEAFAAEHADEVDFHRFAQWLMTRSLQRAQRVAREAGMRIGIIADLAVGAHGGGSQTWTRQSEFLPSMSVGAPPDILNGNGQAWGISAFSPRGLKRHGYRAFIEMLRANLAYSGGVRIDHVMGLMRLWVMPDGASPGAGAYLNYPFIDQLRLIALESTRHRALVVGEDLGTVPPGLREELARRNILGMRVLLFEQDSGRFIPPSNWPHDALATTTTHDLPSISGWFAGRDIDWRHAAGHRSAEQTEEDRPHREREKAALDQALRASGALADEPDSDSRLSASIDFIGRTPAPLALLPLEDVMAVSEQPNLPGPGDDHPNWRRRWPMPVAQMLNDPQTSDRLKRLAHARHRREE